MFLGILKKQLILKGIITSQDWDQWKNDISVDFIKDNHFTELKEAELMRERINLLSEAQPFVGEFFSRDWVLKNVLRLNDEEVKNLNKEIAGEEPTDSEPPEKKPEPNVAEVLRLPMPATSGKEEETIHSEDELIESMSRYLTDNTTKESKSEDLFAEATKYFNNAVHD